jgi:hypothetical protein
MGVIQDWGDEVNRMRARINPNARIEPTMAAEPVPVQRLPSMLGGKVPNQQIPSMLGGDQRVPPVQGQPPMLRGGGTPGPAVAPEVTPNPRWQSGGVVQLDKLGQPTGPVPSGLQGPGGGGAGAAGPEISPADILRRRLQQIPGTPDPRLRVPPVGPAPEPYISRFAKAAIGAEQPVAAAAPVVDKTGRAFRAGQAAANLVSKVPAGIISAARKIPNLAGIGELGGGLWDAADAAQSGQPYTLRSAVRAGVGAASLVNPAARSVATGMSVANELPDTTNMTWARQAKQSVDYLTALAGHPEWGNKLIPNEQLGTSSAGPALDVDKTLASGKTLAERQAEPATAPVVPVLKKVPSGAQPTDALPPGYPGGKNVPPSFYDIESGKVPPFDPKTMTLADYVAKYGSPGIGGEPGTTVWDKPVNYELNVGGKEVGSAGAGGGLATRQNPADVETDIAAAKARRGQAKPEDVAKAAKQVGAALPTLEQNEEGTGYQLVHPSGEREDTVQVIGGQGGNYIQSFAGGGHKIFYGQGEAPEDAIQRYFGTQAVDKRLQAKLTAGEPLTDDDVKAHAMAHGLSTAEATKAQTERAVAATQAQGHMGSASTAAQGGVDVAKIHQQTELAKPVPLEEETGGADMFGKPYTKKQLYVPGSKEFVSSPKPKPDPIAFDTAIREAKGDKKKIEQIRAQYKAMGGELPDEKAKGYRQGGLIKSYALGGPIEDPYDYQAGEEPEDYALRVNNPGVTAEDPYAQRMALAKSATQGQDYGQGGPIQGPAGDDAVPGIVDGTTPARFTKDEYVIPVPVVKYFGTKYFDDLIAKYHERGKGQAKGP